MKDLKSAILLLVMFTIICGGIYPVVVTGFAYVLFPKQATGSFIADQSGRKLGSALIGQPFSAPEYFWPRPSATPEFAYNAAASSGSNSGPSNPDYLRTVAERVKSLRDSGITGPLPADLVQASGSGLDPHISPEAALMQISRIAKLRRLSESAVASLVEGKTERPQLGIFGVPRVNVLELNLALDTISPVDRSQAEKQ